MHTSWTKPFQDVQCCCYIHFKFGEKKRFQEDRPNPSYKARRGNFKGAREYMNTASKPCPSCPGTVMGRQTSGEWCWRGLIQSKGLFCWWSSHLYLFNLLFPRRVSFIAACITTDCPLILCFIMPCELNTTGVQGPLRAQHPLCCSCPQPAEFIGVLWLILYLLPEQGFLWVSFHLFSLLFLVLA